MSEEQAHDDADLRVAIIGYGLAGAVFHAPLVAATPGMRVAAIVTGNHERQARAKSDYPDAAIYARADDLWERRETLDMVVVAAPNRAHVSLGVAALDAGLAVVVDKPFAPSSADASRLIETAERAGRPLSVFQNRRWDNDFLTLRRLIAADLLGPLARFESRFERFRPLPKAEAWRELEAPEEAGGLLFDLGAHLIDQALQLFGQPTSVYAEMSARRPGAVVDDDTFVALRFANDAVAHLWMSAIPRHSGPRFRVVGLRGVYEKEHLDPQEEALRTGARPGMEGWGHEPVERWGTLYTQVADVPLVSRVETAPGQYEAYYAGMRAAIREGAPVPVDPRDALNALRVIEAARTSARDGRLVALGG